MLIVLVVLAIIPLVVPHCGGAFARFLIVFTRAALDALECGIRVAALSLLCLSTLSTAGITIVAIVMSNFMLVHISYFGVVVVIVDAGMMAVVFWCLRVFTFRVGLFLSHISSVKLV